MRLPRAHISSDPSSPVATARWALPSEVERHLYQPGDLWLGTWPVPKPELEAELHALEAERAGLLGRDDLDEDQRDQAIEDISARIAEIRRSDGVPIGSRDDRHMVSMGGTRAGKGTSAIIPNLQLYPGSVLCIDPKGENARITAARRGYGDADTEGLGQTVVILDPYNTTRTPEEHRASWNPLDLLVEGDDLLVDRATSIADSLIERTNEENSHFDDSARILIKALILYVALLDARHPHRNLITVHSLLARGAVDQMAADKAAAQDAGEDSSGPGPDAFTYLLHLLASNDAFDGSIAGAATMLLAMGDRERGGVLSTARRSMEFVERPAMKRVLQTSSFELSNLKTDVRGVTIFLCLPPQRMKDCSRWLRLIIGSCLEQMYEIDEAPATGHPVLFLLEEFATLKHMEIIEHAAGYAAGFGVKLWMILQDITQLKRYYRESWETFLGNAGVIQAFANSDYSTLDYLSKKLGETEVVQHVRNVNTSLSSTTSDPGEQSRMQAVTAAMVPGRAVTMPLAMLSASESEGQSATSSTAINEQIVKTALMTPDEIERHFKREEKTQIVLIKGERPLALLREDFHDSQLLAALV